MAKTPKSKNVKPKKTASKSTKRPITIAKAAKTAKAAKIEETDAKKRNFVLLDDDNQEIGRYTGHAPRQAALKVANTGITSIRLRETGVRRKVKGLTEVKIHVFSGSRKQRKKTANDPKWLPDKINYPAVKKVGVEWLEWSS